MAIQTYGEYLKAVQFSHTTFEAYDRDRLQIDEGVDIPESTKVLEYGREGALWWVFLDYTPPSGTIHNRCRRFLGMILKPDGIHELDPCRYIETERYENVTVSICRCKRCGHQMLEWRRQPNTIVIREEQDE